MDCLFCKIVAGEIPSKIVYEDDLILGFQDISPVAPFHTLFITKAHYSNINELSHQPEELAALFAAIRKYTSMRDLQMTAFAWSVTRGCVRSRASITCTFT